LFSVSHLHKSFPTPQGDLKVLTDINLDVSEGEFVAIIGESGSGKSTLLQILGTLDHPDSGSMILDGKKIQNLNETQLAKFRNHHIGFIYQSHHLIPELTALENIMLPLLIQGKSKDYAIEQATHLLSELGLSERANHTPAHLSGGEAQRVAVARAIITKPKFILADEPTGNLDEKTASTVFSMMHDACKSQNLTVIMVTHSLSFAKACDKIFTLKHGVLSPHYF